MLEEFAEILGIMAGTIGTIMSLAYFPQAYKLYKRKSSADISPLTFSIFLIGVFIWLLYGFSINNMPLIIANIVGVLGISAVLITYYHYKE